MASCGCKLVVQGYGGGVRYHCPACDVSGVVDGDLSFISWTNGPPPQRRRCRNDIRNMLTGRDLLDWVGLSDEEFDEYCATFEDALYPDPWAWEDRFEHWHHSHAAKATARVDVIIHHRMTARSRYIERMLNEDALAYWLGESNS